jgi:hypothetical protein
METPQAREKTSLGLPWRLWMAAGHGDGPPAGWIYAPSTNFHEYTNGFALIRAFVAFSFVDGPSAALA